MHVVVCSVFSSPHFALATGFRFTAIPLLHECHFYVLSSPPSFTAIPFLFLLL